MCIRDRTGEKGLYQYDIEDETYQNFEAPEVTEEKVDNSFLGKVKDFVAKHLLLAMAAGTVLVLLLLILVIVLAIKVFHRNQELDDLYEEYDIPLAVSYTHLNGKRSIRIFQNRAERYDCFLCKDAYF